MGLLKLVNLIDGFLRKFQISPKLGICPSIFDLGSELVIKLVFCTLSFWCDWRVLEDLDCV